MSADPRVAAVLAAAAAPAESPLFGEAAALEAFRREYTPGRRSRRPFALSAKMAIAGGLGAALMAGGVAAAATGVPLGAPFGGLVGHHHSSHPARPVTGTTDDTTPVGLTGEVPSDAPGHASRMASLATSTTATGVAKGATICTAASKTRCKAGQHGQASSAPSSHRPSTTGTPNSHAGTHPANGTAHRPATGTDHSSTGQTTATSHLGLRAATTHAAGAH